MGIWTAVGIGGGAVLVWLVMTLRRRTRRSDADMGSVSGSWISEHRSNRDE